MTHASSPIALSHSHSTPRTTFLSRLYKNFFIEFKEALSGMLSVLVVVIVAFYGCLLFLFEFPFIKAVAAVVVPLLLVYGIGKYMTLLSMTIVSLLAFVLTVTSKKVVMPILGVAVFFSFFIVFLI